MAVRPKWLRDICAILFSAYYIIYANEADEKVRKCLLIRSVNLILSVSRFVSSGQRRRSSFSEQRGRKPPTHTYVVTVPLALLRRRTKALRSHVDSTVQLVTQNVYPSSDSNSPSVLLEAYPTSNCPSIFCSTRIETSRIHRINLGYTRRRIRVYDTCTSRRAPLRVG